MTRDEYDVWFGKHCNAFTGIQAWLAKFPPTGPGVTRRGIMDAWARTLERIDFRAACSASEDLASGREDAPRSFDDHPRTVAAIARRKIGVMPKPRTIDGQPTVRCRLCDDTGMVRIWQPSSLRHLRECEKTGETPSREKLRCGAVACTCEAGECCRWIGTRYDAARHCRIERLKSVPDDIPPEPLFAEQQDEALVWLHRGRAAAQANYEPAFERKDFA